MYTKLPNLMIAFHGCDEATFENVVVKGNKLKNSTNDYDWLGHGQYFWEFNYERAYNWAVEQSK